MLQDRFGRVLTYLRVSLLKGCNLSCKYCMPERIPFRMDEVLSAAELEKLVGRFVERGITKLRLTGGEPTIRPDLVEIVERLARLEGVRDIALSTNAVRLRQLAQPLRAAGVRRINVSLDSLEADAFKQITGSAALHQVLDGIEAAREVGFHPIKLNTVVMRGVNDGEVEALVAFAAVRGLEIRFIEMMPTGATHGLQPRHFVSNQDVFERLGGAARWEAVGHSANAGPARDYRDRARPQAPTIGFINPLSQNFCSDCNRLRLTADGKLRTCLFGQQDLPLRPHLTAPDWQRRLDAAIDRAVGEKQESHQLESGDWGSMISFVQVGG
ncbi:MAG: GTP 3',8-cyclase MoaA [Candidatus Latescibacterota bacterium]|nr:MAG: GTP 3',8-cyclase MoaA [Candidatus Latescibacterota bacterium]